MDSELECSVLEPPLYKLKTAKMMLQKLKKFEKSTILFENERVIEPGSINLALHKKTLPLL